MTPGDALKETEGPSPCVRTPGTERGRLTAPHGGHTGSPANVAAAAHGTDARPPSPTRAFSVSAVGQSHFTAWGLQQGAGAGGTEDGEDGHGTPTSRSPHPRAGGALQSCTWNPLELARSNLERLGHLTFHKQYAAPKTRSSRDPERWQREDRSLGARDGLVSSPA